MRSVRTSRWRRPPRIVRPRRRRPAAPRPVAEFGVTAALALQVGGTLRRVGKVRRVQETGISLARHRRPWFTSRTGMICCPIDGHTLNAPSRGKVSHGFRIIFPGPRGARPGRTSSSGKPPPGRAPAPRPPPRRKVLRTGGVARPVPRRRLPPRAGSAARPATGRGRNPRRAEPT